MRERGYAEDDGEQEIGVHCLAVGVPGAPAGAAISISGPTARMARLVVADVIPLMHQAATELARELRGSELSGTGITRSGVSGSGDTRS